MYAAIVCPHCVRTRIIDLGTKTTVCPYCGERCDTKTARILFRGNDARSVKEHLTKMSGIDEKKDKKDLDPISTLEYRYSKTKDMEALVLLAEGLSNIKGEFTLNDVRTFEPKNAEKVIERMLDEMLIIECRPGIYREP